MTIASELKELRKDKDHTKAKLEGYLLIAGYTKSEIAKEFKKVGLIKESSGFFNETFIPHITTKAMSSKQLEELLKKESTNCRNGKAHWERIRQAVESAVEKRSKKANDKDDDKDKNKENNK